MDIVIARVKREMPAYPFVLVNDLIPIRLFKLKKDIRKMKEIFNFTSPYADKFELKFGYPFCNDKKGYDLNRYFEIISGLN